ncbi:MAG: helix-turn-helix domain-containing protein [Patescibacteria group bacterium]
MTQATALAILQTGVNVFLTGEPGSGKTHTVNSYVRWLRSHGIPPAITASTGIAATHISGMTIHSWCGIGIKKSLSTHDLNALAANERVARRVRNTSVLIIDEVSMLSAQTLAMADAVCRKIRQDTAPFGGLQVVVVGDFFQLPPVVPQENRDSAQLGFGEDAVDSAPFAFRSPAWDSAQPVVCYLTEQHRQEDAEFLSLLSAVRSGTADEDTHSALAARRADVERTPQDLPRLYAHNADVDRVNETRLAAIPGIAKHYTMISHGKEGLVATLQRGCLSPETLSLKVGARVMFTKNNPDGSFVNGTVGEVQGFGDEDQPVVRTLRGRRIEVEPMEWTITDGTRTLARITQLPLRLAWAITIHKSQGMTLDAAVMDLSQAFEYGQGYVALSRVRSLTGLHLLGWNERSLEVHPEVIAQDQNFQQSSITAETTCAARSKKEQAALVHAFIVSSGGKPAGGVVMSTRKNTSRGSTYDVTLELVHSGASIHKIAKARSLTEGTIISHMLKLFTDGRLTRAELEPLISPALQKSLPKIQAVFKTLDVEHLSPIFEKLGGAYSYDDLRIARALLETSTPE